MRVLWARAGSDRGLCAVIRSTELTAVEVWSGPAGVGEGGGIPYEDVTAKKKVKLPRRKIGRYKAVDYPFKFIPEKF